MGWLAKVPAAGLAGWLSSDELPVRISPRVAQKRNMHDIRIRSALAVAINHEGGAYGDGRWG
jgi:hypothetical protein